MRFMSRRTSGSAFSLTVSAHDVCFTNMFRSPASGSMSRMCRMMCPVMRWHPRVMAGS